MFWSPPELSEGGIWMFNNVDMDMRSTYPVQNFFSKKNHPFCMVLVLIWATMIAFSVEVAGVLLSICLCSTCNENSWLALSQYQACQRVTLKTASEGMLV